MKRALVIVPNLLIIVFVLLYIFHYTNYKEEESNRIAIEEYEKMTVTVDQIITNYLEDEQHLCDIWSNYVKRSAEAGTPMTAEEVISRLHGVHCGLRPTSCPDQLANALIEALAEA